MQPRRRTLLTVIPSITINLTILLATATVAAPGAAQSSPVIEINTGPSNNPEWTAVPPTLSPLDFQMKIEGDVGGWTLVGLEPDVPNGPTWLRAGAPTPWSEFPEVLGAGRLVTLNPNVFRFYSRLGTRDFLSGTPGGHNVRSWYAPLLQAQRERVWASSTPGWSGTQATYGDVSRAFWRAMNVGFETGNIPDPTRFSTEQTFRWSAFLRATQVHGLPTSEVDNYFHSQAYFQSVKGPKGPFFGVRMQPIWLGSEPGISNPGTSDVTAPAIQLPPIARVGDDILIPFRLPDTVINYPGIVDLIGPVRPGETRYFTASGLIPPLTINFPRAGGGETPARGHSAVHRGDVLRYRVIIPQDVANGDIMLSDRRGLAAFKVGEVTDVLPQLPQ